MEQERQQDSFSAQFEANYTPEKKRAQRERREAQEATGTHREGAGGRKAAAL